MIGMKSKITRSVLAWLVLHKDEMFYVNDLARKLDLDPGNLHRKLVELETEGILKSRLQGNQRYYGLDAKYPLLREYTQIILKTVGLEHQLREVFSSLTGVARAFLFGSYAADAMDAGSDIDVIVIGTHDPLDLMRRVSEVQKRSGREINLINLTPDEFAAKRRNDPFLKSVMEKPKIKLL